MSPSKKPGGNGKKSLAAESGLDDSALESVVGGVAAPAIAKIAEGFEHAAQAVAAIHIAPDAHAVVTAHSSPIDTVAGSQHAAPGPVATVHSSPIDTVGGHGPVVGVSSDPIAGGHPAAPGPAVTVHSSPVDMVGGHGPVVGVSSDPIAGGHPAAPGPVATVHSSPIDHVSSDPLHAVSSGVTNAAHSLENAAANAAHAVENVFCHAAGTRIAMHDGTYKAVEQLKLGDEVLLGGNVIGRGEVLADYLYGYRGTVVNGRHAVFEDGRWLRVEASALATPLESGPALVYPVVTANHLLVCEQYICADVAEMDEDIGSAGRLAALNADTARNRELTQAEDRYGFSFRLAA